ncbi:MAG: hypothetical protein GY778_13140 [bacterium]|nr:hypothetical protein [bacterium]
MKPKNLVSVLLLAFVGVSVGYLIIGKPSSTQGVRGESEGMASAGQESGIPDKAASTSAKPAERVGHKLIAYYFHRTQRCRTCRTIEAYAEEALRDAYPEALKSGEIEWRALNLDESANEHFVEAYALTSSNLVLVDTEDGEQKAWRNLQRVWELVNDELEFKAYVEGEAMAFMEEGS